MTENKKEKSSFWDRFKHYIFTSGTGLFIILHIISEHLLHWPSRFTTAFGLGAIVIGGFPILMDIFGSLRSFKINIDVLVAIAVIAAAIVGHYLEAGTVLFIHLLGEMLETITVGRAKRSIHTLLNIVPETVRIKRKGGEEEIPVSAVNPGDILIVRPGERIGTDGVVVKGNASVDQAPITGESMPVEKTKGDTVYSGTLNKDGAIEVEATKVGEESTIAGIKTLIRKAQENKAPIQRTADKFAGWYVPIILAVAVIIFFVTGEIIRSITLLVIACPCALILGPPTAIVAAIGNAARRGFLIKSGAALEMSGRLNTVVFDKTGTLTYGKPQVVDTKSLECRFGHGTDDILRLAAVAEKLSEHPLGQAIVRRAADMDMKVPDPEDFSMQRGKGVVVSYEDFQIIIGSREHMKNNKISISPKVERYMAERETKGETVLLMAHHDGRQAEVCGAISIADTIREEALPAVNELKGMNVHPIMHTGDNPRTAQTIAHSAGIEHIQAELLPEEKVAALETYKNQICKVAMVGDGINDAPSLAAADVGLAMGTSGTDVTVEAADVVLMTDDLGKVPHSIKLGRTVLRTIRHDIIFAVAFNLTGLLLASTGVLSMVQGAVLHQISSLVVVLYSMRMLLYRPDKLKK